MPLPAPCRRVRSHYQRCWTICKSHRLQQGRCRRNYCCCFSRPKDCQAPNAACHVSSASQASPPAGKDSPLRPGTAHCCVLRAGITHSFGFFPLLDCQDVSYGAVRWQNTLCSAPLKRCVGAFEPAPKARGMNRKAESSRAACGGDLSTAPAGERRRIRRLVLPASRLLTGCGCRRSLPSPSPLLQVPTPSLCGQSRRWGWRSRDAVGMATVIRNEGPRCLPLRLSA